MLESIRRGMDSGSDQEDDPEDDTHRALELRGACVQTRMSTTSSRMYSCRGVFPPISTAYGIWCSPAKTAIGAKEGRWFHPGGDSLEHLRLRNEYLIWSHHPMRDTLIAQTGHDPAVRRDFLRTLWHLAEDLNVKTDWRPPDHDDPALG